MSSIRSARPQARQPERCRNVAAFAKSLLSRRSAHAISTHQVRSAFARAVGYIA